MAIYIIGPNGGPYKIGTSKNVKNRLSALQTSSPVELLLIKEYEGGIELEKYLHEAFSGCRIRGEWFNLTGDDFNEIHKLINNYGSYKAGLEEQRFQVTIRKLFTGKDFLTTKTINQLPLADYRTYGGEIWGWYISPGCHDCLSPTIWIQEYGTPERLGQSFLDHTHIKFIFEKDGQLFNQVALLPNEDPAKTRKNRLTTKQLVDILATGQIFL